MEKLKNIKNQISFKSMAIKECGEMNPLGILGDADLEECIKRTTKEIRRKKGKKIVKKTAWGMFWFIIIASIVVILLIIFINEIMFAIKGDVPYEIGTYIREHYPNFPTFDFNYIPYYGACGGKKESDSITKCVKNNFGITLPSWIDSVPYLGGGTK